MVVSRQYDNRRFSVVVYGLEQGGTERQLLELLTRLRALGWRSTVFTLGPAGSLLGEYRQAGIDVVEPRGLSGLPWLSRRVQAVFATMFGAMTVALRTRLGRDGLLVGVLPAGSVVVGLVSLIGLHGGHIVLRRNRNHYQKKHLLLGPAERTLNRRAAAVIGNSREVTDDLLAEGVDPRRIALVLNGVDSQRMASGDRRTGRAELGLADDELAVLCVANLIDYKGHADLLEGAARVNWPGPWRLLLAGRDDGIGPELHAQASRLGIGDHVSFLGPCSDIPLLLAAADIGALVSHEEGFSNTVLEGMAAGLPMLVSKVGGNVEAIGNGESGLAVMPRDPDAIAAALSKLARDPYLRQRLGMAGRERTRRLYTLDACVGSLSRVLDAAVLNETVPADLRPYPH